jgi:hypothetical protein
LKSNPRIGNRETYIPPPRKSNGATSLYARLRAPVAAELRCFRVGWRAVEHCASFDALRSRASIRRMRVEGRTSPAPTSPHTPVSEDQTRSPRSNR